ncbi:MaoC family dehydratase [Albimonas pacifica]|uniref:Acyl dehydratase n=1 Tax=Albimonas pacifica TaxID=1114924 RepID=A0A1I3KVA6_9RHOB|nr:MaoC family dehydratase [Albimonas pacifica]SFI76377.1 Acyl dehydratase [Albimonas pacifica]
MTDLRPPVWFEDLTPGTVIKTAGATMTEGQIIEFAMRWDPQPFHIDVEAAKESMFGGLAASGFHTMLTAFRLLHATNFMYPAGQGSGGMESLRWLIPVRPGDTIRMECEVTDARVLKSKPHMGVCAFHYHVYNQRDEQVMDWKASAFYLRRPENRPGNRPEGGTAAGAAAE